MIKPVLCPRGGLTQAKIDKFLFLPLKTPPFYLPTSSCLFFFSFFFLVVWDFEKFALLCFAFA